MASRWTRIIVGMVLALAPGWAAWAAATARGDLPTISDLATLESRLGTESTNSPLLLRAALEYHNRAAFGSEDCSRWLSQSRSCLDRILQLDPQNTFARTLLGSAVVISAREAFWPGAKIRRVREGLALMDAALASDPENADARFTRASNNLFLPGLFQRESVVREDFAWLQERADRGEFAADFRQYVFLYHGRAQVRWGEAERARSLWEAGIAIDPNSKVAAELREALGGFISQSKGPRS